MRTLYRDKKTIYICHKYTDGKLIKYSEPIALKEFYATTDNETDIVAMGLDYVKRLRIKTGTKAFVNGEWIDRASLYHQGDKVYVHTEPPIEHDVLCKTADYEVEFDPVVTPNQVSVILFKLSGKN